MSAACPSAWPAMCTQRSGSSNSAPAVDSHPSLPMVQAPAGQGTPVAQTRAAYDTTAALGEIGVAHTTVS